MRALSGMVKVLHGGFILELHMEQMRGAAVRSGEMKAGGLTTVNKWFPLNTLTDNLRGTQQYLFCDGITFITTKQGL
jgi:hypothetical protein